MESKDDDDSSPMAIARARELRIHLTRGAILIVIFAVQTYKATKDSAITSLIAACLVTSVFIMIFLLCDVTLRLCQTLVSLADATHHQQQQPGENDLVTSLVSQHFALNTASATVVVIGMLLFLGLVVTIRKCPLNYVWEFGPHVCIWSMIFSFCLLRTTNLAEWETDEQQPSSSLGTAKGLDCGTGMAYSYYYDYLRSILPSSASNGIIEKIENFEGRHNVTVTVHKMFILIPSSGYVPPDFKDASYQWMQSAQDLEEETCARVGIPNARYRVYKIYPDGQTSAESKYAVVEGAMPLLTYHEVQRHDHPESAVYRRYKRQIIETFYEKLQELLQSEPDTMDLCELIYYDDLDPRGAKVNVAKLILERISQLLESST